jgi:EmrB/QacA subfamily drug resistance transporter
LAAIFIAAIEATIVATAMPSIVATLGDFEIFSWVFTAYLLTQAATVPIYGRLADLYGRKPILLTGIGLFLLGSVLCGFAWSMAALIAFRVLQGIGAGAIQPVAQTLVGDLFQGEERARKQAYVSASFGTAALLGPVIGAFLVAHASWPVVFWINVPLGIVAAAILALSLHETVERRPHRIDYLGSMLMIAGTTALMIAVAQVNSQSSATMTVLLVGAAGCLIALFFHERRTPEPMLPLKLWRNRYVAGGNIVNFSIGATMIGIVAFLPAYIQGLMGHSTFIAGLALTAVSGGWPLGGFIGSRIMLRATYRTAGVIGGLVLVIGNMLMIALDPGRGAAWAIVGATVVGLGMGISNNCFLIALQANTRWMERGAATSSTLFMRIMGQSLGAAAFGGILNAVLASRIAGGPDLVSRLMDPALRKTLAPADLQALIEAFAQALHSVYLISLALAVTVLATAFVLPTLTLLAAEQGGPATPLRERL